MNIQESLINRIRIDIHTKRIRTYGEVAKNLQIDNLFTDLYPSIKPTDPATLVGFNMMIETLPTVVGKHEESIKLSAGMHGRHLLDDCNWLPPHNPLQTATLFPHQHKAAKDIIYDLIIRNFRGVLLTAAAGDGKTFIFCQVLRWLKDKGFFKDCLSPWPCVVVTKSAQETLVKQTEKVAVEKFGLRVPHDVFIISYDALRSSKGLDRMIKKTKEHYHGDVKVIYKWVPFIRPKLLIADEVQAARREGSIQHQVILNYSEVEEGKFLGSSATAFTKIAEAKAVVCNMGVNVS